MALALAGCTTARVAGGEAEVSGTVDACVGAYLSSAPPPKVRVELIGDGREVREVTLTSGSRYRFVVPPGSYELRGWWGERPVTLAPGSRRTVELRDTCK